MLIPLLKLKWMTKGVTTVATFTAVMATGSYLKLRP